MKKNPILTIVFFLFSVVLINAQSQTVLWSDDFEGDWSANWHVDAGTWEIGIPTSGPNTAYAGDKCAATVLGGNYNGTVSSRLIRHTSFTVPSATENPRLRFWHWYSISSYDYGNVQIRASGTDDWINVSPDYTSTGSNTWTYPSLDLSDYAGQSVQIAFYFYAKSGYESTGWYIDDVEVITGPIDFFNPENWENGIGDWASEKGTWEVGAPSSGPNDAYGGDNCAATVLNGNYAGTVSSRLISPTYLVPSATENPRLRFWHWYSISSYDYGNVQIKVAGTDDWINISPDYTSTGSNTWTYPSLDLSDYAGQSVQIAFYFYAKSGYESTGWYIDDVEVITGPIDFFNPENWENGIGDWASEKGTWEVGAPSSGPNDAYGGDNCAATVLNGNYAGTVSSRLLSPTYLVPSATENPRLRFWHWYSISSYDYGNVQIKVSGTDDWINISPDYTSTGSNVWTYTYLDLSGYAGQSVQIAFYFYAKSGYESTGWYIDDVIVEFDSQFSTETEILTYSFENPPQTGDAAIDATNHSIDIEVENGTNLTDLIATFTLSNGATASVGGVAQQSGSTANDFTDMVMYVVTAEDGITVQNWEINVDITTGLNEIKIRNINIYPNPFSNQTTIEFNNPDYSNFKLSVFSISGNKVFEQDNITSDKIVLKKGLLPSGIYIVELKRGKSFENKMIIIK